MFVMKEGLEPAYPCRSGSLLRSVEKETGDFLSAPVSSGKNCKQRDERLEAPGRCYVKQQNVPLEVV